MEDSIEDTSDTVEKLDHRGSTQFEASNNEEGDATDDRDVPHSSGGRGDEFSVESLDENDKKANRFVSYLENAFSLMFVIGSSKE